MVKDLYGARCGALHSYSFDSEISKIKKQKLFITIGAKQKKKTKEANLR